jgi:putative Ca2+/H+ antiporter (TMEM165/GDT1 family)
VKLSSLPVIDLVVSEPQTLSEPTSKTSDRATVARSSDYRTSEVATVIESTVDSLVRPQELPQAAKAAKVGKWGIFASTFFTIFLAEMGDKTQLATLLMSAQSEAPWVVFLGAAIALIATSLLGVLIGRFLATRLSPKTLETSAGALLLFISAMLLWDVVHF